MIRVNGVPLELVQPEILRLKVFEPILILGKERFANVDIRVRVKGGGQTSQIYGIARYIMDFWWYFFVAIRQAIAKSLVAYNQKCTSSFW